MAPEVLTAPTETTQVVTYSVSEAYLSEARVRYGTLNAGTSEGYELVRMAIGELRDKRGSVEKRRVELKSDALAYGRKVDSEAKRLTGLLEAIEEPLKLKKSAVDDEKARVKFEAEAAKLRALQDEIHANEARQEAERKAVRDAEEARIAADRAQVEAERAKLAEERRQAEETAKAARAVEDARLQVERVRLQKIEDAQRAEGEALRAELKRNREADEAAARAEREKIDAERRAVEAERQKAERAEFERQAKVKAEAEAIAKAERDRLAAAERQARIDALKPDLEKVRMFAQAIRNLAQASPKARTKDAKALIAGAVTGLGAVADAVTSQADRWK